MKRLGGGDARLGDGDGLSTAIHRHIRTGIGINIDRCCTVGFSIANLILGDIQHSGCHIDGKCACPDAAVAVTVGLPNVNVVVEEPVTGSPTVPTVGLVVTVPVKPVVSTM